VQRVRSAIEEANVDDPIAGMRLEQVVVVDDVVRVELAAPGRLGFLTLIDPPMIRVRSDARLDYRPTS
jgi:hypothetical protein